MRSKRSVAAALIGTLAGAGAGVEALAESTTSGSAPSSAVTLGYTADYWRNVKGGVERGGDYLDLLDVAVDWEKPSMGLRAHANLIYTNGKSFSERVGDSHVVSNIEADRATRVLQAWLEYAPRDPDRSLKVGLYDLNSEFDASEVGGALINSTFGIGLDASQSGVAGPSIFPYTGLALRGRWRVDDRWMLQGVIIDAVPLDPNHPRRAASLRLDADEGALLVAELEHRSGDWRAVVGHWRYSEPFPTIDSIVAETTVTEDGNSGTYAFVEGPIWDSGTRRLSAVLRIGAARPAFNAFDNTVQTAFVLERALLGREGEHLALGIARARNGASVRRASAALGEVLTADETVVELTWRVPINERVAVQPDVQYIVHPGSTRDRDNALALGLRIDIDFSPR